MIDIEKNGYLMTKGEPMSLILKGIDLPKCSNEDCVIVIRKDKAVVKQTGYKEKTIEAIQIPKGHGRLGDLDEIGRRARASYRMGDFGINEQSLDNLHVIEDIIDNAPTILEEE